MGKGELDIDARGLIHEAYRIEGITDPDCRTIFLDWAMGLGAEHDPRAAIRALRDHYGPAHPGHPMNAVLEEGLARAARPARRRKARKRGGA
ncbi:hypothetical protein HMH01_09000 [Halovulum dunhuangense]|uniref:Uncharacterized protein n=1 Tax=Halovulum dunhuangense TaxID=1505036 RepID=A0A849L2X2_9RHOB|nr:hypothetical protein [Halovulum dunhuangense]NNU80572.1 hypothetical protein [Halovulum dunhuangense]